MLGGNAPFVFRIFLFLGYLNVSRRGLLHLMQTLQGFPPMNEAEYLLELDLDYCHLASWYTYDCILNVAWGKTMMGWTKKGILRHHLVLVFGYAILWLEFKIMNSSFVLIPESRLWAKIVMFIHWNECFSVFWLLVKNTDDNPTLQLFSYILRLTANILLQFAEHLAAFRFIIILLKIIFDNVIYSGVVDTSDNITVCSFFIIWAVFLLPRWLWIAKIMRKIETGPSPPWVENLQLSKTFFEIAKLYKDWNIEPAGGLISS